MTQAVWLTLLWIGVAVVFFILEAATVQLVAIWLAIGALVTAIPTYFGIPFWGQFAIFVAVSALTLLATRPLVKSVLKTKQEKTNLDRVVGQEGVVLAAIPEGGFETGRVHALGLDWSAVCKDARGLAQGTRVLVERIEGVKLVVSAAEEPQSPRPQQPQESSGENNA